MAAAHVPMSALATHERPRERLIASGVTRPSEWFARRQTSPGWCRPKSTPLPSDAFHSHTTRLDRQAADRDSLCIHGRERSFDPQGSPIAGNVGCRPKTARRHQTTVDRLAHSRVNVLLRDLTGGDVKDRPLWGGQGPPLPRFNVVVPQLGDMEDHRALTCMERRRHGEVDLRRVDVTEPMCRQRRLVRNDGTATAPENPSDEGVLFRSRPVRKAEERPVNASSCHSPRGTSAPGRSNRPRGPALP